MLQASFPSICIAFSQKNLLCKKKIKEENNKPLASNNKGVRKLGMDTLHIDTLFLPAIILKRALRGKISAQQFNVYSICNVGKLISLKI